MTTTTTTTSTTTAAATLKSITVGRTGPRGGSGKAIIAIADRVIGHIAIGWSLPASPDGEIRIDPAPIWDGGIASDDDLLAVLDGNPGAKLLDTAIWGAIAAAVAAL